MRKKKNGQSRRNKQELLSDAVHSVPGDKQNQNHNTQKETLGPNTKR